MQALDYSGLAAQAKSQLMAKIPGGLSIDGGLLPDLGTDWEGLRKDVVSFVKDEAKDQVKGYAGDAAAAYIGQVAIPVPGVGAMVGYGVKKLFDEFL